MAELQQVCKSLADLSGRLGEISMVEVWDHSYWAPGRGFPADCDPPPELDWEFYVGPAPMRPYNPNIYYNYGYDWFKLSGAGHQVAWGVHHFDIVLWAMGAKYPVAASAMGGHFAYQDNFEWPNTFGGMLEFGPGPVAEKGFFLGYTMRMGLRRVRRARQVLLRHGGDHGGGPQPNLDRTGAQREESPNGSRLPAQRGRGNPARRRQVSPLGGLSGKPP